MPTVVRSVPTGTDVALYYYAESSGDRMPLVGCFATALALFFFFFCCVVRCFVRLFVLLVVRIVHFLWLVRLILNVLLFVEFPGETGSVARSYVARFPFRRRSALLGLSLVPLNAKRRGSHGHVRAVPFYEAATSLSIIAFLRTGTFKFESPF